MFDRIGGKIKALAEIFCWIGIIFSGIAGVCIMFVMTDGLIAGLVVIALGTIASWAGSFMFYGFGELVEKTQENNQMIRQMQQQIVHGAVNTIVYYPQQTNTTPNAVNQWQCSVCGAWNHVNEHVCRNCGK